MTRQVVANVINVANEMESIASLVQEANGVKSNAKLSELTNMFKCI